MCLRGDAKGLKHMNILEGIFEMAKVLVRSNLSESEESALKEMCAAAFHELSFRLRDDLSVDDIRDQFIRAAATLGLSLFVGVNADKAVKFSAGSVNVEKRSGDASARSLRKQAELMLTGFLKDGGFAFRAVRA